MGKKSLIKSTDKQKTAPKNTTSKKNAAATKTTKKASSPKKKTAAKKNTKKVNMKELIFKKFEPVTKQPTPVPASQKKSPIPTAPEFIASDNPKEKKRLRSLLMMKFSMDDIKSAAKAPSIPVAGKKPEPPAGESAISPKIPAESPSGVSGDDSTEAAITSKPVSPEEPSLSKPSTTPESDFDASIPETDPVKKAFKYGVAAFIVLILLLVGASFKNSTNYYIVKKGDAIEIWRGRFSPTGKQRLILLHGVKAPENSRTVYSRNHVLPLAFNYYLEKADALLDVQGIPDYEGIREYLNQAKAFAINSEMKNGITARLNNIDLITLFYKIDVFLHKGTAESLDHADQLVKKAGRLTTNAAQNQLLETKSAEINERRAAMAAAGSEAAGTTGEAGAQQ